MALTLLIDFGSTYTKVTAVDVAAGRLVATAKAPTTVDTDVMIGLTDALSNLKREIQVDDLDVESRLACSSAAGGLRMVAVGLVPKLTLEAARMAALSAGAKLVGAFGYELSQDELEKIVLCNPDIILLAGGTDGGNREVILANARALAALPLKAPIVVAGNKVAAREVHGALATAGKDVRVTENVLPSLNELNIEPARETIRGVFIERIIRAKGIDRAKAYVDNILMPTPTAVLEAARLLATGTKREPGLGELLVVDVGGATTDVHSMASGKPTRADVVVKGLPEPYAKRTVEGDLGVRYNVLSIVEEAGLSRLSEMAGSSATDVEETVRTWSGDTSMLPASDAEHRLDAALARCAVDIAVTRHSGVIESYYTPMGTVYVQTGKDLSGVGTVIGTGGPLAYGRYPLQVLEGALAKPSDPSRLKPTNPRFLVDSTYTLYAMGLLGQVHPDVALRIMKSNLHDPRGLQREDVTGGNSN